MFTINYAGSDGCPLYAAIIGARMSAGPLVEAPLVILLHGGGPDHQSLVPLGQALADHYQVVLPDIRGYGQSVCIDPTCHTWTQYVRDVIALLDHLGVQRAVVGGAGLGTTITLRTALAVPDRVQAAILISVEDIEDDEAKAAEIAFLDAFAARVRAEGIAAAWAPLLATFPPIIGAMVRDAIPRSTPASIAAAAAIGHDRAFRSIHDLARLPIPTLVIPGIDARHPTAFAEQLAQILPQGVLAPVTLSTDLTTPEEFAHTFAPVIRTFLSTTVRTDREGDPSTS